MASKARESPLAHLLDEALPHTQNRRRVASSAARQAANIYSLALSCRLVSVTLCPAGDVEKFIHVRLRVQK